MVNNYNNINKTNIYVSTQIIEYKKDHDICGWKSRFSGLGLTDTTMS
jgi:hypothetical protein